MITSQSIYNNYKTSTKYKTVYVNRRFTTISILQTDLIETTKKLSKITKKLTELNDEKEILIADRSHVSDAVKAASKMSTGETASKEETESFSHLKENYGEFLNSESESENDGENNIDTSKKQYVSLLNKIMGVKNYIKKEIKINNTNYENYESKASDLIRQQEQKNEEKQEKGKGKEITDEILLNKQNLDNSSSLKRKAEPINEESSKKNRETISDYLDDLPYNPFDDVGTD